MVKPTIRELCPNSGPAGTEVVIMGEGFGEKYVEGNIVSFNSVKVTGAVAEKAAADGVKTAKQVDTKESKSWSDGKILVKVPTGATTGEVVVVVNGVLSNGSTFTVTAV